MCFGKKLRRATNRTHWEGQQCTANVAINVLQPSGKMIQKLAVMWHPAGGDNQDTNLASAKLVTEVLGMEVQYGHGPSMLQLQGNDVEVQGFVDIQWRMCEQGRRGNGGTMYCERFGVTAQEDPPFDLLVGRKLAQLCGLDG